MAQAKTAAAPQARRHPAELGGGPWRKPSEAAAWLRAVTRHEQAGAIAVRTMAEVVYRQIRATGTLPGGLDKASAARRARRRWLAIAEAMEDAARVGSLAHAEWVGMWSTQRDAVALASKVGFEEEA